MGEEGKLDINEFLKRHLLVKNWMNYREQVYTKTELIQLCELAIEMFRSDATLAEISPPVTIVGDIHGQYADLVRLLNSRISKDVAKKKMNYGFAANRYVFLGDYVDRGTHSIECICLVFSLKIVYTSQYVLLRGNHETRAINFAYGFREELITKLNSEQDASEVWEKFNEAFSHMPLACLVGHRILCMHGGIGPDLHSLDDIRKIRRPLSDVATNRLALDLLWADPVEMQSMASVNEEPAYGKNLVRGLSVAFNEAAVKDTCKRLNLHLIVRAHQMMNEGFKFFADRKLITIFSAPRYMNETDNRGATLRILENGKLNIAIMKNKKPLQGPAAPDEITRGDDLGSSASKKKSEHSKTSSSSSKTKSTISM